MSVFGIWNEEIDTLYPQECVSVTYGTVSYSGKEYCELIHAKTAEVLATYQSEFYKGMPAFTVNSYGKGKAYYQCFRDTGEFWNDVAERILDELEIKGAYDGKLSEGVRIHKREDEEEEYLFVQNYMDIPTEEILFSEKLFDLEEGRMVDSVKLAAYDVKILKKNN